MDDTSPEQQTRSGIGNSSAHYGAAGPYDLMKSLRDTYLSIRRSSADAERQARNLPDTADDMKTVTVLVTSARAHADEIVERTEKWRGAEGWNER